MCETWKGAAARVEPEVRAQKTYLDILKQVDVDEKLEGSVRTFQSQSPPHLIQEWLNQTSRFPKRERIG